MSFNYFISERVFEYLLEAVELVARDGWKLLPLYDFDPATGLWTHVGGRLEPPQSLDAIRYVEGRMAWQGHRHQEPEERLEDYLDEARQLLAGSPAPAPPPESYAVGPDFEMLRWFVLPSEVRG